MAIEVTKRETVPELDMMSLFNMDCGGGNSETVGGIYTYIQKYCRRHLRIVLFRIIKLRDVSLLLPICFQNTSGVSKVSLASQKCFPWPIMCKSNGIFLLLARVYFLLEQM